MRIPSLSYPITRDFGWRWFSVVAYTLALIALCLLIPFNYAIYGYQTVSILSSNYFMTQPRWYDGFIRPKKPGQLCDPKILAVGDSFTTNSTVFQWTVAAIWNATTDAGHTGVFYNSTTLDSCDLTRLRVRADLRQWTARVTAEVLCTEPAITMTTSFDASYLEEGSTVQSSSVIWNGAAHGGGKQNGYAINSVMQSAGLDVINQMQNIAAAWGIVGNTTYTPDIVTSHSIPARCPRKLSATVPYVCPTEYQTLPPNITAGTDMIGMSGSILQTGVDTESLNDYYNTTFANFMQAMHAAVRYDLGLVYPNNFLTNTSVINTTFTPMKLTPGIVKDAAGKDTVNATYTESFFVAALNGKHDTDGTHPFFNLPVQASASVLQVPYLCKVVAPRPAGQVIVSVVVATLTMFGSGWAFLMLVATFFAKRHRSANHCEKCLAEMDLEYSARHLHEHSSSADGSSLPMMHRKGQ